MNKPLCGIEEIVHGFYVEPKGLVFPEYTRPTGETLLTVSNTKPLHVPEWVKENAQLEDIFERVGGNLEQVDSTLQQLEYGGDTFEIAIIHSRNENKKGVMLHISTYSSSISTNLGNAFEFAVQGALYEDFDHVYVASPGNGGSSPIEDTGMLIDTSSGKMGQKEYFRKTGRTTYEDRNEVKPLPYLLNMQRALEKAGVEVTGFIGTDSAGGSYATGLAIAMEEGQISHGFFSERSNFKSLGRLGLSYGMLVTENIRHGNVMRTLRVGGLDVIDPLSIYAPRINDPQGRTNKTLAEEKVTRARDVPKVKLPQQLSSMVTSLMALGRGPEDGSDPLVSDVNAMLAKHPDGKFTFTLAEYDVLYRGEANNLATQFLGKIDVQRADVTAIILKKLPHAYHTALPLLQDALRRSAFGLTA